MSFSWVGLRQSKRHGSGLGLSHLTRVCKAPVHWSKYTTHASANPMSSNVICELPLNLASAQWNSESSQSPWKIWLWNLTLRDCSQKTSRKFGLYLTPLPLLSHSYSLSLMYLCHKKIKPPPPSLCDIIYEWSLCMLAQTVLLYDVIHERPLNLLLFLHNGIPNRHNHPEEVWADIR